MEQNIINVFVLIGLLINVRWIIILNKNIYKLVPEIEELWQANTYLITRIKQLEKEDETI